MTRKRAIRIEVAFAASVIVGCSAEPWAPPAPSQQCTDTSNIVGGTESPPAQDAVVLIVGDNALCTGTMLAPNLVLTARHCVAHQDDRPYTCGAGSLKESGDGTLGADLAPTALRIAVGAAPHAIAAMGKQVLDEGSTVMCSHDIALVVLDRDIPRARVAAVRATPPVVGEMTTAIGYGEVDEGVLSRVRRERSNIPVLSVGATALDYRRSTGAVMHIGGQPGELVTGEAICDGDSGGPLLDTQGRIVGVTSRGVLEECADAPAIFSDVASHRELIDRALTAAGHAPTADPPSNTDAAGGNPSPTSASRRSPRGC
jgi:hypothetical protein